MMIPLFVLYVGQAIALASNSATNSSMHPHKDQKYVENPGMFGTRSMPFALRPLELLFYKRDDFGRNSRGREFLGTEYAKLYALDLAIDGVERFLRVASAFLHGDGELDEWFHEWVRDNWQDYFKGRGIPHAQELFDFAFEIRFGSETLTAPISHFIAKFEADFKKDHPICPLNPSASFPECESILTQDVPALSIAPTFAAVPWNLIRDSIPTELYSWTAPSSLSQAYEDILSKIHSDLTRTLETGTWSQIHRGGPPTFAWPPPETSKGYGL